jgi:hypothetical protein
MKIILSKEIKSSEKENIINALYEIAPKMPIYVDYLRPVTSLLASSLIFGKQSIPSDAVITKSVFVKVIGDDIYDHSSDIAINAGKQLKGILGNKCLYSYYRGRDFFSNQKDNLVQIELIDNFDFEDIDLLLDGQSDKTYFLYSTNTPIDDKRIESVKFDSFAFDSVKAQFEALLDTPEERIWTIQELADSVEKKESDEVQYTITLSKREDIPEDQPIADSPETAVGNNGHLIGNTGNISIEEAHIRNQWAETQGLMAQIRAQEEISDLHDIDF